MNKTFITFAVLAAMLFASASASAQQRCGYWTQYTRTGITIFQGPPCNGPYGWQDGQQGRYWGANQGQEYGGGGYVIRQPASTNWFEGD